MSFFIEKFEQLENTNRLLKNIQSKLNSMDNSQNSTSPQNNTFNGNKQGEYSYQQVSDSALKFITPVYLSTQVMKDDMLISGYQQIKNPPSQVSTLRWPDSLRNQSTVFELQRENDESKSGERESEKSKYIQQSKPSVYQSQIDLIDGGSIHNSILQSTGRESDRRTADKGRSYKINNSQKKEELIKIEEYDIDTERSPKEKRNMRQIDYHSSTKDLSKESLDYTNSQIGDTGTFNSINPSKMSSQMDEGLKILKNRLYQINESCNTITNNHNKASAQSVLDKPDPQMTSIAQQMRQIANFLDKPITKKNLPKKIISQNYSDSSLQSDQRTERSSSAGFEVEDIEEAVFLLRKENARLKIQNNELVEEVLSLKTKMNQLHQSSKQSQITLESSLRQKYEDEIIKLEYALKQAYPIQESNQQANLAFRNEQREKDAKIARLERHIAQIERERNQYKREQLSSLTPSLSNSNNCRTQQSDKTSSHYFPLSLNHQKSFNLADENNILSNNYRASNNYLDDKFGEWKKSNYIQNNMRYGNNSISSQSKYYSNQSIDQSQLLNQYKSSIDYSCNSQNQSYLEGDISQYSYLNSQNKKNSSILSDYSRQEIGSSQSKNAAKSSLCIKNTNSNNRPDLLNDKVKKVKQISLISEQKTKSEIKSLQNKRGRSQSSMNMNTGTNAISVERKSSQITNSSSLQKQKDNQNKKPFLKKKQSPNRPNSALNSRSMIMGSNSNNNNFKVSSKY